MSYDDLRAMRSRHEAAIDALDSGHAGSPNDCASAMVARTTTDKTYPTAAATFYAVTPCDVDGAEQEGQAATYLPRAEALAYALNLGTAIPPSGIMVICHAVGGRWCFRYDGGQSNA